MRMILTLLFISFFSWASYSADLDFQLLPSKAIKPGEVAIQVLPVKSTVQATLLISNKSNLGYKVEGPSEVTLEPNQMQYLTFITTVPSRAKAGLLHELEIQFIDPQTNEATTQILTFTIALKQNLDFFVPDQDLTTYTQSKVIPLRISNSGNSNEIYDIEIENFTPSAQITLNNNRLAIPPQQSKILQINLRFSHRNSHVSFFEIRAKLNGVTKFKKRFKVRFISNGTTQRDNGDHYLDTQMVISNDFISIDGDHSHLSNVFYSANGNLSDYVSLSAYVQAQMIDGKDREISDMRFDFEGENWYVHLGSDVSLSPTQSVLGNQIDGVAAGYDFENGFQVGALVGVNEESDDVHTSGSVSYDFTPNQRLFLLVDQNQSNGDTSAAAGYDGRFQITKKLSFAPSLIVSDAPEQGMRINYRQTLKYMVRDNFPIIFDSGYIKNQNAESLFADIESTYIYKNIVFRVGGRIEHTKETNEANNENETRNSHELFASMAVPISNKINGQVQFRYLGTDEYKEYRPELSIQYSNGKFIASMRSAIIKRDLINESTTIPTESKSVDWEPLIEIDLSYQFEKMLVQGRAYYEKFNADESRIGADASLIYYLNNKWLNNVFVKAGGYQDNFVEESVQTRFLQVGSVLYQSENTTFEVQATIEDRDDLNDPEYFIGARLTITDRVRVPRRVQELFGGNRTGSIKGKVCIDTNNNQKCEDNEMPIPEIKILIEGLAVTTDEKGIFKIPRIDPGEIKLQIEKDFLNNKSLATSQLTKMVSVQRNQETNIDFGLFSISSIRAFAFFDRNNDGLYDADLENELDNIEIKLSNEFIDLKKYTNGSTPISFDQLKNGSYNLNAIVPGEEYYPTTPSSLLIELPSQANKLLLFGFAIKESQGNNLSLEESLTISPSSPLALPPNYQVELNFEYNQVEDYKLEQIQIEIEGNQIRTINKTGLSLNTFSETIRLNPAWPQQIAVKIKATFISNSLEKEVITKSVNLIKP